jgi:hypothetical protein
MLTFNPLKRITVAEALAHPFFAAVRDPQKELSHVPPADIDAAYTEAELPMSELRVRVYNEVVLFVNHMAAAAAAAEAESARRRELASMQLQLYQGFLQQARAAQAAAQAAAASARSPAASAAAWPAWQQSAASFPIPPAVAQAHQQQQGQQLQQQQLAVQQQQQQQVALQQQLQLQRQHAARQRGAVSEL